MWRAGIAWLAALAVATGNLAEKPHPRLWFTRGMETPLREKLAADPLAARLHEAAMKEASRVLKAPTCKYDIPDGKRLLTQSRLALHNIIHCAWAWRMSGGEEYRLRAITELEAACALKDWNPSHFLDTAEMATAVAVGYDWLHETLTPGQRAMCERAIIDKALKPAKKVHDKDGWWTLPKNNWAQVCGSGIAIASAAIAGNDEGLSEDLFSRGLALIEKCERFYQPDGMYPEGPGYWQYGTNYHVMLLAACGTLDRDFRASPLLRKAGDSIMHMTSPTRLSYNFADGNARHATPSAAQCWLARHFNDPVQARHVRDLFGRAFDEDEGRVGGSIAFPLAVMWTPSAPGRETVMPNAAVFHGEQAVALFRSGWDGDSAWFAIKGGTPAASHGHMDVGSFAYDAHGTRWLHDLGSENYNLPGHFGNKRWDYYRLQNRSHNTLEIGGRLQNPDADPCPLVSSSLGRNPLAAVFDLTDAYAGSASKVKRTARFDTRRGSVLIEDEINAPVGDVVWRAFTDADARIDGDRVILGKDGKQISLRRVSKTGAWSLADAKPPTAAEKQNEGFRAIVLTAPKAKRVALAVEIVP
jgi:hypothetical protein